MSSAIGLMPFSLAIAGVAIKASLMGMFLVTGLVLVVTMVAAGQRVVGEIV